MVGNRFLFWPVMAAVFLILAWGGWWFYASSLALSQFQNWSDQRQAEGYEIGYDSLSRSGFPLRVTLTADQLVMVSPDDGTVVIAEQFAVSFPPWRLDRYDFDALAPVSISTPLVPDSAQTPIILDRVTGRYLRADQHRLQLLAKGISGPRRLQIRELGVSGSKPFTAAPDRFSPIFSGQLELVDGWFPAAFVPGLPDRVAAAVLEFTVSGPGVTGAPLHQAQVWRDQGGIIDIHEVAVAWGELTLRGDGTVTLDDYMRPLASLSLKVAGIGETAQRFEDAGLIDANTRRYIKLGVGLLALGGDQSGMVPVPVSIQDGVMSLGPVAITDVPPIFDGIDIPGKPAVRKMPDDFPALAPPPTVSEETLNLQSGNQ